MTDRGMTDCETENELGGFLRSCREAVTPAEAGLPTGPRRRTPGLRRAELATLAGISIEYLTRLEQGRDRHPSMQVLAALADALRLAPQDRIRLRNIAKSVDGHVMCPAAVPPARTVRATVRAVLDGLEPAPAAVVGRLGDILAHTAAFARLTGPIGLLDGDPPNVHRYLFTDPRSRAAYPDWESAADRSAAELRSVATPGDTYLGPFVDSLAFDAGEAFTARFRPAPAPAGRPESVRLVHPEAGPLRFSVESMDLTDADGQTLRVYLPSDPPTAAALTTLTTAPPTPLRIVR